jgi:hypothetical protein
LARVNFPFSRNRPPAVAVRETLKSVEYPALSIKELFTRVRVLAEKAIT